MNPGSALFLKGQVGREGEGLGSSGLTKLSFAPGCYIDPAGKGSSMPAASACPSVHPTPFCFFVRVLTKESSHFCLPFTTKFLD